jgi:hypothetical protein
MSWLRMVVVLAVLVMTSLVMSGCTLLRAVLAPEDLVAESAGQVVNQAGNSLQTFADTQAASDVERILAKHGDAANADELRRLQQDLNDNPLMVENVRDSRPLSEAPPPSDFDRRKQRTKAPQWGQVDANVWNSAQRGGGHRLAPDRLSNSINRGEGEPFASARGHDLPQAKWRVYELDFSRVQMRAEPGRRDKDP